MSALTDARDVLSEAHKNAADLFAKTVAIHAGDSGTAVTGGAALSATVRGLSTKEQRLVEIHFGLGQDRIFEVARQGTVDLTKIRAHKHKIKYGDVFWEVIRVEVDDAETTTLDEVDASVYLFTARRMQKGGIGELAL